MYIASRHPAVMTTHSRKGKPMGAYLDRLNTEYDELTTGLDAVIDRAADENRDVTEDEAAQVERDRSRMGTLKLEIERYTAVERESNAVQALRATVPAARRAPSATVLSEPDPAAELQRSFPTIADYAITVHRATSLRDPAARELLERTAHQTTADNPGLIPRPMLGPVLNLINVSRPFIQSITKRPLPAGKFDRPVITQHVAIGKQVAEKDPTASQKLLIGSMPVTATTYAGHLNISRQDIKWTSPSILNIVFDDFAAMYALATCDDASDQFVASVTGNGQAPIPVDADDPATALAALTTALYTGTADALGRTDQTPDTLWVAPDVWAQLGSMMTPQGGSAFPSLSLTTQSGNPMGLRLVVDQHFAAGTAIAGPSKLAEWYEDVDGLMQVGEPDVLGQLVGYAGFGAFLNVSPDSFTAYAIDTNPAAAGATSSTSSSSGSGSTSSKSSS